MGLSCLLGFVFEEFIIKRVKILEIKNKYKNDKIIFKLTAAVSPNVWILTSRFGISNEFCSFIFMNTSAVLVFFVRKRIVGK